MDTSSEEADVEAQVKSVNEGMFDWEDLNGSWATFYFIEPEASQSEVENQVKNLDQPWHIYCLKLWEG